MKAGPASTGANTIDESAIAPVATLRLISTDGAVDEPNGQVQHRAAAKSGAALISLSAGTRIQAVGPTDAANRPVPAESGAL